MSIPLHELEAEALALSDEDRAHLLERLIESFEPDSDIEKAWVAEALRREADVKAGRARMLPGEEALARIRTRIG